VETKQKKELDIEDSEVVFEKKTLHTEQAEDAVSGEEIDPIHTPISEMLKERAAERRLKMKNFNYKFNSAKIDDIERVPAYKRQGINLDESRHSSDSNISNTSISLDDNDDMQIRNNNSFLHDNVD